MKKITFILFALVSGTVFAQTATATVHAEIVAPIVITNVSSLNFGSINKTTDGGEVTVNTKGERSFTNSAMEVTTNTPITAAIFDVTAATGYSYSVNAAPITLTGATGSVAMDLSFTHNRELVNLRVGTGDIQKLRVGGTLKVNPNQDAGLYTGQVAVTVAYE